MSSYTFIFSQKAPVRVARHMLFWMLFSLHVLFFRFYVLDLKYLFSAATWLVRLKDLFLFLPVSLFYAYFAIYFLLPRYILTRKYGRMLLVLLGMSIFIVAFSMALSAGFDIALAWDMPLRRSGIVPKVDFILNNGLVYPLTVSGFAIGIKMGKNFYLQQKQYEQLAAQKINADVRLLKSQVYPRFLFHALQTIHQDMLHGSANSPGMLLRLSELLSYLLYESDTLMPLEKELLQVKNYVALEKAGRGKALTVDIRDSVRQSNQLIEPLLLFPLIEHVFDTIDQHRGGPLTLHIELQSHESNFLFSAVISGLLQHTVDDPRKNTRLRQVYDRLQAQYGERHDLSITSHGGKMIISLSLTTLVQQKTFQY